MTDMRSMFLYASAFNHDISSWTGSAATSAQTDMFLDASAFQAKFSCDDAITGPASSCDTIKSDWVAPSPPYLPLPHHHPLPHHLPLPHHHLHLLLLRRQPRRLRKFPRRPRRFSSPFSRSGELAILIIAPRPPERRKARRRKSISQTKPPFRYKKKNERRSPFSFFRKLSSNLENIWDIYTASHTYNRFF